ncbi:MAG TPA: hypothetical protein VF510_09450 [Ktedonobacterales bacterium]
MSWFLLPDDISRLSSYTPRFGNEPYQLHSSQHHVAKLSNISRPAGRHVPALGSAHAAEVWSWAPSRRVPAPAVEDTKVHPLSPLVSAPITDQATALRIPAAVLRRMAAAAQACGRSEADIWAEAAEDWLAHYALDNEPQPPTPAAAALSVPRPVRSWSAIDALLTELRASEVSLPEPSLPAA